MQTTLGTKTKTETRTHAEKLGLILGTISEKGLMESLGCAVERVTTEQREEEMDIEENETVDNERLCTRCKKEIVDEKQIVEQIRIFVQECHITDCNEFNETDTACLNKRWPEEAYTRSELRTGNPLQEAEGAILLAMKTKEEKSFVRSRMEE